MPRRESDRGTTTKSLMVDRPDPHELVEKPADVAVDAVSRIGVGCSELLDDVSGQAAAGETIDQEGAEFVELPVFPLRQIEEHASPFRLCEFKLLAQLVRPCHPSTL